MEASFLDGYVHKLVQNLVELFVYFGIVEILFVRSVARRDCSDMSLAERGYKAQTVFEKVLIRISVVTEAVADRKLVICFVWTTGKATTDVLIAADNADCLASSTTWVSTQCECHNRSRCPTTGMIRFRIDRL